mgnify:CR=1 FL=1
MTYDMRTVTQPKSDQINADDLVAGPMTIRVRDIKITPGTEQPVSIYFEGSDKAFRPCKTMARMMSAPNLWGPDAKQYIGRSLTLYRDPDVKWGGLAIGGIRISHMSHIDGPVKMAVAESKAKRKIHTVQILTADVIDPAAKWTADFIGKVAAVTSMDELKALETLPDNVAAIAKLEAKHPKLHEQIAKAIANIADGFVSQAAHGEQTTLVDALDALTRADTREDVDAIVNGHAGLSDEDADKLRSAAMERIGEIEA